MYKISVHSKFKWPSVALLTLTALIVVVLLPASRAEAQQNSPPAGNPQNGKALFLKNGCYECHGTVGQGGTGPRLAPNPLAADRLIAFVRKPARGMPPYSAKVMSDTELVNVRAYLATIPPPPPVENIPLLNQ